MPGLYLDDRDSAFIQGDNISLKPTISPVAFQDGEPALS